MLIYNHQKEFLGIDKHDLNALGFFDLASLKAEVSDFADLFVKTPGYIHNFKHVHWIDFITCAESSEKPKAIINVNSKSFKCTLDIKITFLVDHPSSEAYLIYLTNLHPLSEEESKIISADLSNKTLQKPVEAHHEVQQEPLETAPLAMIDDDIDDFTATPIQENITLDDDFKLDVSFDDTDAMMQEKKPTIALEETIPTHKLDLDIPKEIVPEIEEEKEEEYEEEEEEDDNYIYDPQVASSELGLPLDLIEEFIQDFILQAKEFKEDLYTALENNDLDNVKTLSHKLKGVAANLRIENAFETLSTINTASDTNVIKANIHKFYRIVAKLAGEEVPKKTKPKVEVKVEKENIAPKEEMIAIDDTPEIQQDDKLEINLDIDDTPEVQQDDKLEINLDMDEEEVAQILDDKLSIDLDIPKEIPNLSQETVTQAHDVSYSKKAVANEIGIDLISFNELFQEYQEESHNIFINMETALENGDITIYDTELEKFRNMTENMRIHECDEIVEHLTMTHDKDEVARSIQMLRDIIQQILNQGD